VSSNRDVHPVKTSAVQNGFPLIRFSQEPGKRMQGQVMANNGTAAAAHPGCTSDGMPGVPSVHDRDIASLSHGRRRVLRTPICVIASLTTA